MPKTIRLTNEQYDRLEDRLKEDYPQSVLILRSRRKRVLGFTPRLYSEWDKGNNRWKFRGHVLDFYDDRKRTIFLMKYSDIFKD